MNRIEFFEEFLAFLEAVFDIFLRGNYKGTDYCRVGQPCLGENYPTNVSIQGFYSDDFSDFYVKGLEQLSFLNIKGLSH